MRTCCMVFTTPRVTLVEGCFDFSRVFLNLILIKRLSYIVPREE